MRDRLRKARGNLLQRDVAPSIGISDKTLSAIELGRVNPSFKVACNLSRYYNVPIEELFPDLFNQIEH